VLNVAKPLADATERFAAAEKHMVAPEYSNGDFFKAWRQIPCEFK